MDYETTSNLQNLESNNNYNGNDQEAVTDNIDINVEEESSSLQVQLMLQNNPAPDALPDGWVMHRSRSHLNHVYYFNQFTGDCRWEAPFSPPNLSTSQLQQQQQQQLVETLNSLNQLNTSSLTNTIGNDESQQNSSTSINDNVKSILKKSFNDNDAITTSSSEPLPDPTTDNTTTINSNGKRNRTTHDEIETSESASPKKSKAANTTATSTENTFDDPESNNTHPDQVRVLHILKKHRESRRPSSWRTANITISKEEAIVELQELLEILRESSHDPKELRATFIELAKTESDCSSAKRGGDLGFFGKKQMKPNFEKTSFGLKVGELSGIVDTSSGVHIILRLG